MKVVKKTAEYTVYQKRSGRYAVENAKGNAVNKEEKVKILLAEDLIKIAEAKAPEPVVEEATEELVVEADAAAE